MTSPIKFFNEVAEIDDLLDHYLDMTPEQVMTESIRDRLKYTLAMYQTELEDATDFLSAIPAARVYRAVAERQKEQYKRIEPLVNEKLARQLFKEERRDAIEERFKCSDEYT